MGLSNNPPAGIIPANPPSGSELEQVSRLQPIALCICGMPSSACGGHPDVRFPRPERLAVRQPPPIVGDGGADAP